MKLTILDLVSRYKGETIKDAIDRTTNLAQIGEEIGYDRI